MWTSSLQSRIDVGFVGFVLAATTVLIPGSGRAQCPTADTTPDWICEPGVGLWFQEAPTSGPPSTNLDHLGISASSWGDFDGDGKYDLVFGGMQLPNWDILPPGDDDVGEDCPFPNPETGGLREDRAWIVLAPNSICTPQPCGQFGQSRVITLKNSPARSDRLGWSVRFIGDLDGDGCDEVAVSAPLFDATGTDTNEGTVYVIFGRNSVFTENVVYDPEDGFTGTSVRVLRIRGEAPHDWFGFSLAGPGNVVHTESAATSDLLVGAPSGPDPAEPNEVPLSPGKAYVVDGDALAAEVATISDGAAADFVLCINENCAYVEGEENGSRFGWSVTGIGDLGDEDSKNEIAVGALEVWWNCDDEVLEALSSPKGTGRVHVLSFPEIYEPEQLDLLVGFERRALFGYSLSGFPTGTADDPYGDATGDSLGDLLVGEPHRTTASLGEKTGKAHLFSGADLDDGSGATAVWDMEGDYAAERYGWSAAGGGKLDTNARLEFAIGARDTSLDPTVTPPDCMGSIDAPGLFLGRGQLGRAVVYCGADGHAELKELHGVQGRGHLGWALAWLPNLESSDSNALTELLLTAPGWASCLGSSCAAEHEEIGRAFVWFFH